LRKTEDQARAIAKLGSAKGMVASKPMSLRNGALDNTTTQARNAPNAMDRTAVATATNRELPNGDQNRFSDMGDASASRHAESVKSPSAGWCWPPVMPAAPPRGYPAESGPPGPVV